MTKQDYATERLDPRWQKKRLEIMKRDGFACSQCGDKDKTLSVHHLYYVTGRRCWQYPAFSLRTLCDSCHDAIHHPKEPDPDEIVAEIGEWETVADWLCGGKPDGFSELWELAAAFSQVTNKRGNPRTATIAKIIGLLEGLRA